MTMFTSHWFRFFFDSDKHVDFSDFFRNGFLLRKEMLIKFSFDKQFSGIRQGAHVFSNAMPVSLSRGLIYMAHALI